jgi:ABC-type transporter Mla subunit MlaD
MNERPLALSNPRASARRWVGAACVALFLAALAVLAIWSGGWLQPREDFVVRFQATTALSKSSPVLLLGQPIGRVRELSVAAVDGRPAVEVRFWIGGDHLEWMREGATVTERSNLVGSPWLDLTPGDATRSRLAAGSTIPGAAEQGMMDRVLEIQPVVEGLLKQMDTLVGTLNDTIKRIDPILAQVEGQLGTTKQALEEITALIADSHAIFEQLKKDQVVLVGGLTTTLTRMNDELLPGIQRLVDESRGSMADTFGELDQTLAMVQTRLPDLLTATQQTLENTRDITEATKHTWPFNSYWKKKAKQEAAAAKKNTARDRR